MAGEIKKELGESSYHLDSYLNVIFETLADMDLATASAVADKICSNILGDCCIVLNGEEYREKSNFFELVKKYIDEHPTDFKENHTKVEYYAGNIIIENLEFLYWELKKRYKNVKISLFVFIFAECIVFFCKCAIINSKIMKDGDML